MVSLKKKIKTEKINQELHQSNAFLLLQIGRLNHQQLEEIRKTIKPLGKIKVVKNSLYEKVINKNLSQNPQFMEIKQRFFPLKETNAVVFFKELWDEGIRKIYSFIKKDYQIKFKFAFDGRSVYDENEIKRLAQLPAKEILVANLISQIKSPIFRLYNASINPLQKLIYILQQQAKKS